MPIPPLSRRARAVLDVLRPKLHEYERRILDELYLAYIADRDVEQEMADFINDEGDATTVPTTPRASGPHQRRRETP